MRDIRIGAGYTYAMRTIRICSARMAVLLTVGVAGFLLSVAAAGRDAAATVAQTWQMLDYLASDSAGAVKDGAVISTS